MGTTHHDNIATAGTLTVTGTITGSGAQTIGSDASGADLQLYGATTGVNLLWDASADGATVTHPSMTGSSFPFQLDCAATSATEGARQGAFYIYLDRDTVMTNSDGNPDCGFKMKVRNYADAASYIRTRGFDIAVELRTGGSAVFVQGGYLSAKTYSGSTVTDVTGLQIDLNHGATGSGTIAGLIINEVSQSGTGTMYGIRIQTAAYAITREYAIAIDSSAGSWTNGILFDGSITNALDFADTSGNGATYDAGYTFLDATCVGKIQVDVGGNTCYIPLYSGVS